MTESQRPYGWGCHWRGTYCARYGDVFEAACLECIRLNGDPEEDSWRDYFELRLKNRQGELTNEECEAIIKQKIAEQKT